MTLEDRNSLRIEALHLTIELEALMQIPEQYRSADKVDGLRQTISTLEDKIASTTLETY